VSRPTSRPDATLPGVTRFGTEVSFRLGPDTVEEARAIARDLAAAAAGCDRHVLFVDAATGEYGDLAEWLDGDAAAAFAALPATAAVLARLEIRTGKAPRVRTYVMEDVA